MSIKENNNNRIAAKGYASAGMIVSKAFKMMERLYDGLTVDYVSTGYQELDFYTGFMSGNLVGIVGSSGGLSTLVMNLFSRLNRAPDDQVPALLFSLQHDPVCVGRQLLAQAGRLHIHSLQRARIRDSHWPRMAFGAGQMSDASSLYVCPNPASDIEGILQQANVFMQEVEPRLRVVFIDSLQLAAGIRQEEDGLRALKNWAREHEATVVITSRISTRRNSRTGLERVNHDRLFRILGVYTDVLLQVKVNKANGVVERLQEDQGYHFAYDHASGMVEWMPEGDTIVRYPMELILLKNNNGPAEGSIPLTFIPQQCLIESRLCN